MRKCSLLPFVSEIKDSVWGNHTYVDANIFMFSKVNNLFCNPLNKDEMAFYYTYFILKYHKFYKTDVYSKYWMCVLYKNGFIKAISDNYNVGIDISETDIILKINIHYSYLIYRNYPKKLNYWGTKIVFENNKRNIIYPDFVNLKLLDKLIISDNYRNRISELNYNN